jgi:hypothetical protein
MRLFSKPLEPDYNQMLYTCPRCYATTKGGWPHPPGAPCPQQVTADESYIAKLDAEREAAEAQRDYYERAGMPALDTGEAMRTMTKFFTREMGEDDE